MVDAGRLSPLTPNLRTSDGQGIYLIIRESRYQKWFRRDWLIGWWMVMVSASVLLAATLADFALGLGWGLDQQDLVAALMILLMGVILRIWYGVVVRFQGWLRGER